MKKYLVLSALMAFALTASACFPRVSGVVSCPNGVSAAGIKLYVPLIDKTFTTANGAFSLDLPQGTEASYTICIDERTLPPGLVVDGPRCINFKVGEDNWYAHVSFSLKGPLCEPPTTQGPCWLTGGGTISGAKGAPNYSYGGVVNPGCSPITAGGGNWNVVNHLDKLHFKGMEIVVLDCSGVPTKSPKVGVNIIDFAGTGTITGIDGNPLAETPVTFIARAIDNAEPGAGKDRLYLNVKDAVTGNTLLLISDPTSLDQVPAVAITTGNLQIHTSSCDKK